MSAAFILVNIAYLVYAISPTFKDMVPLRITLLSASLLFIAFGFADWANPPSRPAVWWNIPVVAIHSWQLFRLISERREVDLDDEAEAVRALVYPDLDRVSFHALWKSSYERDLVPGEVFIHQGDPVDLLYLVMAGDVEANISGEKVVRLGRLRFLGEISSLTGQTASATVSALTNVRVRVWSKTAHAALCTENAELERAHLRAIGQDLTRKLT